ncbi:MAG TPA: pyridoxal-phosphate dependent enzyme [Candidatus Limnocylindrales bacterium]|nr:pyridoxal-phosphate dependent enzyme [Candidatus Limnocylindrales bacterium]
MQARPFFRRHPALASHFALAELAQLPTPLRRMDALAARLSLSDLYLKDDGCSSRIYGGNKVRKLELLLGLARADGAREVLTFGYAGSNHAAATAVHAAALGMRGISMLMPQENAAYLRTNLLVSAAVGAELHEYDGIAGVAAGAAWQLVRHRMLTGVSPFRIAPGGSSALGTVGFVASAFELVEQMESMALPPPAAVYVPAGSMGSAVGLALGLALLAVPTRVHAVRVTDSRFVNERRARALWTATVRLLRAGDSSVGAAAFDPQRLQIRDGFFGGVYAKATDEGTEAAMLAERLEALRLDVSYTSKTMACLISDARHGLVREGPVVFWNTYNSVDLAPLAAKANVGDLPPRLRRYFD